MITLGINAAFHDSAAVLVIDGVPVAAAEEERFTRIKHAKRPVPFSAWELPFHAIAWCLEHAGLTLAEVDHVGYSFDPVRFAEGRAELAPRDDGTIALPLAGSAGSSAVRVAKPWDSPWDPLFAAYMRNAPAQLLDGAPHHLRKRLASGAAGAAPRWQWHFVDHHLCHQASAFLAAPFERCAVLTLDGRGEDATTTYGAWRDGEYRPLGEVRMPHSLGLLYERVTSHLGFLHSSDEYKVMALAAMGSPRFAAALGEQVPLHADGQYELRPFDLAAIAGPARVPGSALGQPHFDLAASLQQVLEARVMAICRWLREASGERCLAMAGGVALNCVMNAKLRDDGPFDEVWVQPAAGDAGTAMGAALWVDSQQQQRRKTPQTPSTSMSTSTSTSTPTTTQRTGTSTPHSASTADAVPPPSQRWSMQHAYLGPGWEDDEIAPLLRWAGLGFEQVADDAELASRAAALLERQCILGWFQGRMEWGPRALGARSILASPIDPAMQQRLNELKDREDFRPVAPAVTAEAFGAWFTPAAVPSPFMLFTHQAKPGQAERIPSACHSDGSARVQTVHADSNPRFHALLQAFERRTGVPVLVNTSFNVRGQPVVCSPKDALEAFFTTPLDALVIGRCILLKPNAVKALA